MAQGQIYKIHSDFYYVQKDNQTFECKIREVLKKQQIKIVVGDFVEFDNGAITKILPKKSYILRPAVANVDQVVVVSALKHPNLDFHQLNRYISLAKYYKIPVVLCFNKEDLGLEQEAQDKIISIYGTLGYEIVFTSAIEKKGIAAVRFLFVGRFAYYKGCDVLLEAFSQVENAELYLVGSGTIEDELRAKTKEYHLENRVHFLGKISEEELCRQYASCDVFVLPSVVRSEAFGLVQIEAMAFGKPVINTNLPSGVPYVSIDGKTGLTVEPGNAGALAEAMQWMVNHEEERIRMGTAARERMKKEYRLETMRDRILKVYKELVKE